MTRILTQKTWNDAGDVVTLLWTLAGSPDDIRDELEYDFAPYHCRHEYDCCGKLYRHYDPEVTYQVSDGKLYAYVTDTLYRNV